MAQILTFTKRTPSDGAVPLGPAQILFFIGVRYIRDAEPVRPSPPKRGRGTARERGDDHSRHRA